RGRGRHPASSWPRGRRPPTRATRGRDRMRVKLLSRLHLLLYRLGLAHSVANLPVLVLTTKGRRSGKPRTVPLTYFEDGANLVLVASYGGRPHHPAWFENLDADPQVEVK